jgi:hypothetical protein
MVAANVVERLWRVYSTQTQWARAAPMAARGADRYRCVKYCVIEPISSRNAFRPRWQRV